MTLLRKPIKFYKIWLFEKYTIPQKLVTEAKLLTIPQNIFYRKKNILKVSWAPNVGLVCIKIQNNFFYRSLLKRILSKRHPSHTLHIHQS